MSLQKQERSLVEDRDRAESKLRNAETGLAKAKARIEARSSTPGSAHTLAALSRLRESGEIHGILGTLIVTYFFEVFNLSLCGPHQ